MDFSQVLTCAVDLGEEMLICGGEVYRVEDCIRRICLSYGAVRAEVFVLTSSIVATLEQPDGKQLTQTRRVRSADTDLDRVDKLNHLSRELCREHLSYGEFRARFQSIRIGSRYPQWVEGLAYMAIAAAFTVFFGGTAMDALVSALIGLVVKVVVWLTGYVSANRVLANLVASFVLSCLAFVAVSNGFGDGADMIVIGNIMVLIPGIGLTNSIRDLISGDTVTGLIRFSEACMLALAIAGGYFLAGTVMGGVV